MPPLGTPPRVLRRGCRRADFVVFLLAEEDKQSAASLQYWFHVLDFEGDGVLDTRDMWCAAAGPGVRAGIA